MGVNKNKNAATKNMARSSMQLEKEKKNRMDEALILNFLIF